MCAGVVDGTIYAIGGSATGNDFLSIVEAYNPLTDTWTEKASLLTPTSYQAGSVVNGRIYVIGGRRGGSNSLPTVQEYTPQGWQPQEPAEPQRDEPESSSVSPQGKLPTMWSEVKSG